MRCSRLILEAGTNAVTVRFHPRLTVIAGVGRLERESLFGELLAALGGGRAGAHLELLLPDERRLAVVRTGEGTPDRVVDLSTRDDVSDEFRTSSGRIDLLAPVGLDATSARSRLRLRAVDLAAVDRQAERVGRLAALDQGSLWRTAQSFRDAAAWVAAEAGTSGTAPEDAEMIERIEERHQRFEDAKARHENVRHHGIFVAGACSVGAVPAALLNRYTALPFLAIAIATWLVSIHFRRRASQAYVAEQEALAEAGAGSYLGFHLQRVNGLLGESRRHDRLTEAIAEHRRARRAWVALAGDVDLHWALSVRERVVAVAEGRQIAPTVSVTGGDDVVDRLTAFLDGDGSEAELLPVVLDDALADQADDRLAALLEVVRHSSADRQVIYLTENTDVEAWARRAAGGGDVAVIAPAPDHDATTTPGAPEAEAEIDPTMARIAG